MPGVKVTTAVKSGPTGEGEVIAGQLFLAGKTQRGPVDEPMLIRGMTEFKTYYGDYVALTLYPYVQTFFEEGGSRVHVYRVLGSGASASSIDLDDAVAAATLTISAANPGTWGDDLSVEVVAGTGSNVKVKVRLDGVLLWTSRDLTGCEDAANVINTSAVSYLIEAVDNLTTMPVVAADANLSGGADGATVIEQDYIDALDEFEYDLGCGAVALPGQSSDDVWAALIEHANANNRIALCAFGKDDAYTTAQSNALTYFTVTANYVDAEHAAFYFPWIKVPSPLVDGLYLDISPETFVAAARSKAVTSSGPWLPGAGPVSEAKFAYDLYTPITRAIADDLDDSRINALRKVADKVRVYGARSASNDEDNWRYITHQDTINYIVSQAEANLENLLFSPIDARGGLFARIEAALICLLAPIRDAGGLYEAYDSVGRRIDPGYSVRVNDEINPPSNLAQGKVTANIGVRVSSVGDQIQVSITKSNLTTSLI